MDKKKAIIIAKKYLKLLEQNNYKIIHLYIFGSTVKGKGTEDSDIDIAIVLDDIDDSIETQIHMMKIRRSIDTHIEPHPFRINDFTRYNPIVQEIIRTGIKII
jgi:predicted nucleotidyltransferase